MVWTFNWITFWSLEDFTKTNMMSNIYFIYNMSIFTFISSSSCRFNSSICWVKACFPLDNCEIKASFSSTWRPNSPEKVYNWFDILIAKRAIYGFLPFPNYRWKGRTRFCLQTSSLSTKIANHALILLLLCFIFTQLIFQSAAHFLQICLDINCTLKKN